MRLPKGMDLFDPVTTACLLAVMSAASTVREVQRAAGIASTATVHHHLGVLRRAGLVDWSPRLHRTLRATVVDVTTITLV